MWRANLFARPQTQCHDWSARKTPCKTVVPRAIAFWPGSIDSDRL
jgi:hypothetical protein